MGVVHDVSQRVQDIDASALGKGALALSGGGTAVQWITDFGSAALVILNILLALGGIYLLTLKIIQQRRAAKVVTQGDSNNSEH